MTQTDFLKEIVKARSPVVTLAVSSGKGGVGKTTVSIVLSWLLAERGKRVYLIDGDLGLANVDVMLGLSPKLNLYNVAKGEATIDEVLVEVLPNFYVIPGGSGIRELLNMDAKMRGRMALELLKLSDRADYIIADTGAGISDDVLLFCVSCRHTLLVVTPEPTSLTDAYALLKILNRDYSKKEFTVVVNMGEREEAGTTFRYLETVCSKFLNGARLINLGEIPRDRAFVNMVREQSLKPLESVRGALEPLVDRLISWDIFRPEEGALARLSMGILRFKGAGRY